MAIPINIFSKILVFVFALGLIISVPAYAQTESTMEDYNSVTLQTLDKVTARTMTFNARVGSTVKFGPLFIKVQSCRKNPPIEQPESAAFLQIWEINHEEESEWVFSGWMFASSPALSPMDHPIYDVWVLDCLNEDHSEIEQETEPSEDGVSFISQNGDN